VAKDEQSQKNSQSMPGFALNNSKFTKLYACIHAVEIVIEVFQQVILHALDARREIIRQVYFFYSDSARQIQQLR
jgi:hypothetical protein